MMGNSFFVFTDKNNTVLLERFHICTWEFDNNSSLVEFGFEISKDSINGESLTISLYIPWLARTCQTKDLYEKLSLPHNSRFIFNDSVSKTISLDGGINKLGVIHQFSGRNELCILPVNIEINEDKIVNLTLNLKQYLSYKEEHPNVYFRFCIKPTMSYISMRKKGISKSTIIYDVKVNERRNIPDDKILYFDDKELCKINNCFSFNILPNKYDIVFFDNSSLKNVRTLEYSSFNKYLGDSRVKKDELIVVFNKKQNVESYSFFSIFSMERIGIGQFALAILINIICGFLLFIPSYRRSFNPAISIKEFWGVLPIEILVALVLGFTMLIYFISPIIIKAWDWILNKRNKK